MHFPCSPLTGGSCGCVCDMGSLVSQPCLSAGPFASSQRAQTLLFLRQRATPWCGQEANFPLRHPALSAGLNDFFFLPSCGEKHFHCSEKGSFSLSVIVQVVGFLLASEIHYKSQSGKSSNTVPSLAAEFGYVAGSYSVAHP